MIDEKKQKLKTNKINLKTLEKLLPVMEMIMQQVIY